MDGLSGAASVVGVVSITIQLADGFKKLHDFWSSVQSAPEDIQSVVKGIKVLSIVLQQIEVHQLLYGPDPTITEILVTCNDPLTALIILIQDFEPGFTSHSRCTRKWSTLKSVFKKEQIQNSLRRIKEAKLTLVLAQQHITLYIVSYK
ncbi:hypothetical protein B0O99DRAFT_719230 [Bisporella sp. PMI_857]|nr:hypothetical protein B0O99DRAFT_719230 [Bisporella sp. PMI_857]